MAEVIESNNKRHNNEDDGGKVVIWSEIDWDKVKSYVERLQGRIYIATDKKDFRTVKNLQKLCIRSHFVKLYAIRQITQINKGKYTPGVDGMVCQTYEEREEMYKRIKNFSFSSFKSYHPRMVKRVEIPKENGKTRPIGIPTIFDRVIQMLVKTALEPEWERKFHRNSFGFRPGRCCQDAIEVIKHTIANKEGEYILNTDLTGCFDNIAHAPLLQKLHIFKHVVKKWLKAGVIIKNRKYNSVKGTPQGGVISPLLANIALNKLDFMFNRIVDFRGKEIPLTLVRYADDMVILCSNRVLLSRIKGFLPKILEKLGLELNMDKTYLVHKSEGFTFLGFYFIQHLGKWLWIQPDKSSVKRVLKKIKWFLNRYKQAKTDNLIFVLNRIILGWARYYQYCRIYMAFNHMDALVFRWTWRWCYRRHPKKTKQWIRNRYFKTFGSRTWVMSGDTWQLSQFFDIKHRDYVWRVGNRSYLNPLERRAWKQEKHII